MLPKKCKICNKILSIYNHNKYCFAHVQQGLEMEYQAREKKIKENERLRIKRARLKKAKLEKIKK